MSPISRWQWHLGCNSTCRQRQNCRYGHRRAKGMSETPRMRIGFVGLGKLGLPCAVSAALRGHDVMGYDIDPRAMSLAATRYLETGPDGRSPFDALLAQSTLRFGS